MQLHDLRLAGFRNLTNLSLQPGAGLNLVVGPNASGKTAMLEAIYLMSRGRSFRTSRIRELIQYQQPRLQVSGVLQDDQDRRIPIGVERDGQRTLMRYDGTTVQSLSRHARHFPVVLITPESHNLMNGPPGIRRHWLDWGLFHVEPGYLDHWRRCYQALRQRNMLLKRGAASDELDSWEEVLAQSAQQLDLARQQLSEDLARRFSQILSDLLPGGPGNMQYLPGWDRAQPYQDQLGASRDRDRRQGFTGQGPHRADLDFHFAGQDARAGLSRGQGKLFIAGLMIALAHYLKEQSVCPVLLIDDLPAELDAQARTRFLRCLAASGCQTFITTVEPDQIDTAAWPAVVTFHVEQGQLTEVVQ